jgi:uncharacterized protein
LEGTLVIKVVLDTNALMMPFQFKVDIQGELVRHLGAVEIYVPQICIEELTRLDDRKAKGALLLAKRFKIVPSKGKGDEAVLNLALELRAVLVTNDAELRRRAKGVGLKVAYLRGKDRIEVE